MLGKNLLKVGCVLTFTDYLRQKIDTLILQSIDNEINIFLATGMIAILYFIGLYGAFGDHNCVQSLPSALGHSQKN